MKVGSANVPINLVSTPSTTFRMEDPQPRVLPNYWGDPGVAMASEPVFASHPAIQSPTVVPESPQYMVVEQSPPPPPQLNPVGPISPPPLPRQGAYIEHVNGIPSLIRPSRGGGSGGGAFFWLGGTCTFCCAPNTPVLPCGGALWSLCGWGSCWQRRWWVISSLLGSGPLFGHSRGPAQTRGGADLKHTRDCPRCMVHYEMCIQSLMVHVQDLRTQNLEPQRSHQELSQALAAAAGISQFYGDGMTQMLCT